MKQKLSQLPSPALAGVVREKSIVGAIAEIKSCLYDGATMIDLHMSCLESTDVESLRRIINSSKLPVLALNYNNTCDWADAGFDEEARVESFLRAVEEGTELPISTNQTRDVMRILDASKVSLETGKTVCLEDIHV